MVALTKLSKNFLIAFWSLFLYAIFGGFSHPFISFGIFTIVTLWLTFLLTVPKNEDMDTQTAFCINGRGSNCPKGETPLTLSQNCCIYFEDKLDFDAIKALMSKELYKYKRLSHIAVRKNKSTPLWNTKWVPIEITEDVKNRMILKHNVNNNDELYELVDELCNKQFSQDLPHWIFHYIDNNNGLSMWLWRVSHGIADGIRLVPIACDLLETIDGNKIGVPQTGALVSTKSINNKKKVKRERGGSKRINWFNPKTYVKLFGDIYKIWYSINGDCDSINIFKPDNKLHGPKKQIHLRNKTPFKIDDIKALKNKYNVSFNDVITALTCSGIRAYILSQDSDYFKKNKKVTMTSLLAFGFPPKEEFYGQSDWLGNGFSLVDWSFPIQIDDFQKRLKIINRNGRKLKTSFVVPLGLAATTFLARLGFDDMLDDNFTKMFARHSCVFSNLPSWNHPIYFNGVKVAKLEASYMNWIPQFIFISYHDSIYGTLAIDINRFPNAQIIFDEMNAELIRQTN